MGHIGSNGSNGSNGSYGSFDFCCNLNNPITVYFHGKAYFSLRNMKTILSLLLLLPFFGFGQDSCKLKQTRDAYTKEVKLSTGFITLGSNKVTIDANAKEIDIFFILGSTAEGKCFDDASNVVVNYSNSRLKTTLHNSGTMNCEGYFHITFRNTVSTNYNLQKLIAQKTGSFVFTNGKVSTTVALNDDQQVIFQKAVSCLANQAKTLIPTN
jgi:hypothetical protein